MTGLLLTIVLCAGVMFACGWIVLTDHSEDEPALPPTSEFTDMAFDMACAVLTNRIPLITWIERNGEVTDGQGRFRVFLTITGVNAQTQDYRAPIIVDLERTGQDWSVLAFGVGTNGVQ